MKTNNIDDRLEINTKNTINYLKTIETSVCYSGSPHGVKEMTFTPYIGYRLYVNGEVVFICKSPKIAVNKYNELISKNYFIKNTSQ
jgi:hypothetical protein